MNRNLWIGVLTALSAVLFGIIQTLDPAGLPVTTPSAPSVNRAGSAAPLEPMPMPSRWDDGTYPATEPVRTAATSRAAAASESPLQDTDIRPLAMLEFSADFADSVRRARAAGVDEVLLAHAVVAQFHRQSEAIRYGPGEGALLDDSRLAAARAEAVVNLLGEGAYRGWQRSDYVMNHDLAGTGITDAEVDTLLRLNADRERRQGEMLQSGRLDGAAYQQWMRNLNDEYRQQLLRVFGVERATQLGLLDRSGNY